MNEHDRLVDRAAHEARTVLFVGGLDSGKSSMARAVAAYALRLGRSVAYLDADVSQKTVGPPGTVGLKHIRDADDLTHDRMAEADVIGFVGSTSPQDHLLPLVGALSRLRERAHDEGAELVVVDTGGEVSRIRGQLVKYYKVDTLEPDLVVALQRGEELEPIVGVVERFFGVEVVRLGIHPGVVPTTVDERMAQREESMRRYFDAPLQRFRVRPTVFMPTPHPCSTSRSWTVSSSVSRTGRAATRASGTSSPSRGTVVFGRSRRWQTRPKPLDWDPFVWRRASAKRVDRNLFEPNERLRTRCRPS